MTAVFLNDPTTYIPIPNTIDGVVAQCDGQTEADWWTQLRCRIPRTAHAYGHRNWVMDRIEKYGLEATADSLYFDWDRMLESSRDCMAGKDASMSDFLRTHRSTTNLWQRIACHICWRFHDRRVDVEIPWPKLSYQVYWRGDYVEIHLPHHGLGGVRAWVSQPPFKTKILVDVD